MSMTAAPGWYPDQERPGQERYFDGRAWTESRRDPVRRPRSLWIGLGLLAIGGFVLLGLISALFVSDWSTWSSVARALGMAAAYLIIAAGLGLGGVLLLRPESAEAARRRVEQARIASRQAWEAAEAEFDAALQLLLATGYGGRGVVAYRRLERVATRVFGTNASARISAALETAGYDRMRLASHRIGLIATLSGVWLEVYRGYVIHGDVAQDVDQYTHVDVHLDGQLQMTTGHVAVQGIGVPVHRQHDLRQAEVQIVSRDWAVRVPIAPDLVGEARRIGAQLMRHVETLRPGGLSAADVRQLVATILESRSQPAAEKLQQLSNLRFERLLSNEEFEQAKARILELDE